MPTTKPIAPARNDAGERTGPQMALAAAITGPLAVAGQRDVRAFAAARAALAAGLLA